MAQRTGDTRNGRMTAARRAAAIVALTASALLGVFVLVILVHHGIELLLALVGVALTVGGGWWTLTTGMPERLAGIATICAGAALTVIGIFRAFEDANDIALRSAVFIALAAIAFVCARDARMPDARVVDIRVHEGGPPRHPVLLCNPKSGGGKVEQFGLLDLARELGVETVLLEPGRDLEQLARDAVARGADCLGMAGGDGSQALVASIAIEHDLPFVCVSAGTRNHFALDLALNRNDPRESMYAFRDAVERSVDYATVNDRLFVNNVSLGVYAEIVQQDSYRGAKVETTKTMLPEMLGRRAEPFDLQFTTPDGEHVDGAILIMVSNNPYVFGLAPDTAQRRHLDSGQLGVFAVTTRTGAEAARLMAATTLGQRNRSPFWKEFTATEFEVRARSGHAFAGIDGEALDIPTPLHFRIHARGLTLLVPANNAEAADRRRARDVGLKDLVAIASGHEPS